MATGLIWKIITCQLFAKPGDSTLAIYVHSIHKSPGYFNKISANLPNHIKLWRRY